MAALTVSETAFRRFAGQGRVPADGIRYSCRIPVGGEALAWRARLGAEGSQYLVDKRPVTSRTSFFEVSSCAAGGQHWQFGGGGGQALSPVLYPLAPVQGRLRVRHLGMETALSPGQYTVGTSAGPLVAGYGDRSRVIMAFAGERDLDRGGRLTSALGTAVPVDETGGLLFRHLEATLRVAQSLSPGSLSAAAGAVGDLMAAALAGLPPAEAAGGAALRSQVETFIELRLRDPDLGVRQIAAAHHVSRRTVYRLLEGIGDGVASAIRARRLDRCRADLRAPGPVRCGDLRAMGHGGTTAGTAVMVSSPRPSPRGTVRLAQCAGPTACGPSRGAESRVVSTSGAARAKSRSRTSRLSRCWSWLTRTTSTVPRPVSSMSASLVLVSRPLGPASSNVGSDTIRRPPRSSTAVGPPRTVTAHSCRARAVVAVSVIVFLAGSRPAAGSRSGPKAADAAAPTRSPRLRPVFLVLASTVFMTNLDQWIVNVAFVDIGKNPGGSV
jgi:hypothetical protein